MVYVKFSYVYLFIFSRTILKLGADILTLQHEYPKNKNILLLITIARRHQSTFKFPTVLQNVSESCSVLF